MREWATAQRSRLDLFPELARRIDHNLELTPLLFFAEQIPVRRRRETALRAEGELFDRHVARSVLDAADQIVWTLDIGDLTAHQPQHHALALRNEAQRLESAGSRRIVFQKEGINAQLTEQLFCNR